MYNELVLFSIFLNIAYSLYIQQKSYKSFMDIGETRNKYFTSWISDLEKRIQKLEDNHK